MTMKAFAIAIAAAVLAGCGLTPKQMSSLDGVMCNVYEWPGGIKGTTVLIGGASKPTGVMVTPACAVAIENTKREPAATPRPSMMEMGVRQ
jgi:hypothetical protein